MFKVGQLAVNIDEGTTHQIRHIKIQNGVLQNIIENIRRWRDAYSYQ